MGTDGSICDEMRAASAGIWDGLHAHPFLRELASGTLALEKFRFFLEQDNFYLVDYARCLAMGAAKSRDETELRYFTVDLNQVIDAELPSNRALLARVTEMGAADRGGAADDGPGQRGLHQLHAGPRVARRTARDHGGAPAVRVELRGDRAAAGRRRRRRSTRCTRIGSATSRFP